MTGYSSSEDQTDGTPGVGADGKAVSKGLVACPRRYPLGTIVRINGVRYRCGDRLHPKYDDRFDIWFPDRSSAEAWGKRTLPLEIVRIPSLYEQALALDRGLGGQCVYFVQYFLRQLDDCRRVNCFEKRFRGDASQIRPNAATPKIGRVVLFHYRLGHAAVIVDIVGEDLVLAESNLKLDGRVTVGRIVSRDDPHIRGYFDFGGSAGFESVDNTDSELAGRSSASNKKPPL